MTNVKVQSEAKVGDQLETHGIHGEPAKRGKILEVLGRSGHERYRVRWDDGHESIVFPADGVNVIPDGSAQTPAGR
jgi:hypothetical protein